jgi:hypothetical protein
MEGERNYKSRNSGGVYKLEKARELIFPAVSEGAQSQF